LNLENKLYIVSTPIGNLGDITYRAVYILNSVDLIASEDTRTSSILLAHYHIKTPQTSYHEHNEKSKSPLLIEMMLSGKSLALISDAGTPLISDPGFRLLQLAIVNNIAVIPVPGPSSVLAALVASGFPTDRFTFEGYLPKTSGRLKSRLAGLKNEVRTMIFFETPHRILKSLPLMMETLGDRNLVIARELTKKFEQKFRGRISDAIAYYNIQKPRGEIVVIVPGLKDEN